MEKAGHAIINKGAAEGSAGLVWFPFPSGGNC